MKIPAWLPHLFGIVLVWIFTTGDPHPVQIFWALLVALLLAPLLWRLLDLPARVDAWRLVTRLLGLLRAFVVLFVPDAVRSTLDMSKRVVQPRIPMHPGIVAIPIRFEGPVDALLLTNHLTLTPGQLVVDYDTSREVLYLHVIDARDPDRIRAIVQRLHRRARRRIG